MAWSIPIREPIRIISEEEYQRAKSSCSFTPFESAAGITPRSKHDRCSKKIRAPLTIQTLSEESKEGAEGLHCEGKDTVTELCAPNSPSFYGDDSGTGEMARLSLFNSLDSLSPSSPMTPKGIGGYNTSDTFQFFLSSRCNTPDGVVEDREQIATTPAADTTVDVSLILLPDLEALKVMVLVPSFFKDEVTLVVSLLPRNRKAKSHMAVSQATKASVEETFLFCHVGATTQHLEEFSLHLLFRDASSSQGGRIGCRKSEEASAARTFAPLRSTTSLPLSGRSTLESDFLRNVTKGEGEGITGSERSMDRRCVDNPRRLVGKTNSDPNPVHSFVKKIHDTIGDKSPVLLRKGMAMLKRKMFTQDENIVEASPLHSSPDGKLSTACTKSNVAVIDHHVLPRSTRDRALGEARKRLTEINWAKTSASFRHSCSMHLQRSEVRPAESTALRLLKPQEVGDLLVTLQHQAKARRIKVVVVRASNLPTAYFKREYLFLVRLLNKGEVTDERRTCTLPGESPMWNEPFLFPLSDQLLESCSLQLVLMRRILFNSDHMVGQVTIGAEGEKGGAQHLSLITSAPEKEIDRWHKIRPWDGE